MDSAYEDAVVLRSAREAARAGQAVRLAFLDIDSTLTGNPEAANQARDLLEAGRWIIIFNTSRTEEMVLSAAAYRASRAAGELDRPPPHLGEQQGRRVYVPPEEMVPAGLLDPDAIAGSSGARILLRNAGGIYRLDRAYPPPPIAAPPVWRAAALSVVQRAHERGPAGRLAAIEDPANYESGIADVFPPDYRVQIDLDSEEEKALFRRHIADVQRDDPYARSVVLLDDSEPRYGRYKLFLIPRGTSKAHAARRIIRAIMNVVTASEVELLFAGDSYPDLDMSVKGSLGRPATLLLAGGSRLAEVLTRPEVSHAAGENLAALKRRLRPASETGVYTLARTGGAPLTIVVGDLAFPGTRAAETVARFAATLPPDNAAGRDSGRRR